MVVEALRRNRAAVGAVQFTHPFRQKGEVENRIGEPPSPSGYPSRGQNIINISKLGSAHSGPVGLRDSHLLEPSSRIFRTTNVQCTNIDTPRG